MKIGILSFQPPGKRAMFEEIRLKNEALALGHKARIFRATRCQLVYDDREPRVLYNGKNISHYDVVIPRVRLLTEVDLRVSVIKQLQLMGIPMFNSYLAITRAKNKLRAMQMLDFYGIPIPRTWVVEGKRYIDEAVKSLGGPPVILKLTSGSYGSGVVIAESKRAIHSALDALISNSTNNIILIQEYIKEAKGSDTRVFVIRGSVIAVMRRQAKRGEFRSNLELGGTAASVDLREDEKSVALRAAKSLNLEVAGVDIIDTKNGPAVMEVNANPGFQGLEEASGVNVARAIIEGAVLFARKNRKKKKK